MNKKILIIEFLLSFLSFLSAQQIEPIEVYKEVKKFRQSFDLQFGFAKGDLVIFKYKELDGKAIREIRITNADSTKLLYHIPDKPSTGVFQYETITDDVLNFHIVGVELLNREFSMEILYFKNTIFFIFLFFHQ
jgi:hypothetical protein